MPSLAKQIRGAESICALNEDKVCKAGTRVVYYSEQSNVMLRTCLEN